MVAARDKTSNGDSGSLKLEDIPANKNNLNLIFYKFYLISMLKNYIILFESTAKTDYFQSPKFFIF